jgi:DNA processing protein
MREEWFHWVALSLIPGVGKVTYRNLIEHYRAPDKVFSSSVEELRKGARLKEESIAAIKNFRLEDEVRTELKGIEEHGVTLITLEDDRYPKNLYHIPDPPPYLYVKGSFRESDGLAVAVVGSRFASSYGKEAAQKLTEDLARAGVTIVSGMARGIDSCAHRAAIAAGGRTIAVLGCGIDVDYPPENAQLKREIVESGAVVSEVPMSTPPSASNFPGRNRQTGRQARRARTGHYGRNTTAVRSTPGIGITGETPWSRSDGRGAHHP